MAGVIEAAGGGVQQLKVKVAGSLYRGLGHRARSWWEVEELLRVC